MKKRTLAMLLIVTVCFMFLLAINVKAANNGTEVVEPGSANAINNYLKTLSGGETVNLKENEEPKIICDSIASARTNEDCKNNPVAIKNTEHFSQNYQMQAVKNDTQKPSALYLRIDDLNTDKYNRAKRVLDIFDGRTPVIFYLTDTKRKVKAPSSMWVDINPVMIKELKYQLGDENVVAK